MARQIIVLERTGEQAAGSPIRYRVAFWPVVPSVRRAFYADATAISQVAKGTDAITAPELTSLRAGEFVEVVEEPQWASGTGVAAIRTDLQARFGILQAELNRDNRYDRFGTAWDGSTWTNRTTA